MKRLAIAIAVLAVILAAGIAEAIYVDHVFADLEEQINALEAAIKSPEDDALDEVRGLTDWWEHKRRTLELFSYSPDIRAFDKNALSKCQSLLTTAENIHSMLDFNFADII